jgi:spermidine/putrescine transport system substrate-binding protein
MDDNATLDRRSFLLQAGLGATALAVTACGGSTSSSSSSGGAAPATSGPLKGTINFSNYPGWIGKHTIADFEAAHSQVKVNVHTDESSFASLLPKIKAQPGIYDMALASTYEVQRAIALGVAEELDFSKMPHTKLIGPQFLRTPVNAKGDYFVPTDYGKYGIAVRSDLVPETITSWADLWRLAPKYAHKLYVYDFPKDVIGMGLLKLGHSVNDPNPAHVEAAGKTMQELKPTIGNLGTNGIAAALLNGSAAISVTYDYDAYAAVQKNSKIRWIIPSEGVPAYLEGWVGLKGNDNLAAVQALMDFTLRPKLYADFVTANDPAWTEPSVARYLPKTLAKS